ncbi:hypothetical protein CRG98_000555 [Punica granatum]|uniref:Uncharacterized protein n=1 Tax=Punica granatum TaxID=22663 RepID=A0A2I0LEG9_PUNGR|nr:hypothetical protein CRG98_000555 [Punica granatum]
MIATVKKNPRRAQGSTGRRNNSSGNLGQQQRATTTCTGRGKRAIRLCSEDEQQRNTTRSSRWSRTPAVQQLEEARTSRRAVARGELRKLKGRTPATQQRERRSAVAFNNSSGRGSTAMRSKLKELGKHEQQQNGSASSRMSSTVARRHRQQLRKLKRGRHNIDEQHGSKAAHQVTWEWGPTAHQPRRNDSSGFGELEGNRVNDQREEKKKSP